MTRPVTYLSSRGQAPVLAFDDVVLAGLARDGGLYLPDHWPSLAEADWPALARLSYPQLAARLLAWFSHPTVGEDELLTLATDAYRQFDHPDIAPITPLGDDLHLLELFHGPTLAFKDFALQLLGRLFDLVLARRGSRITIVGATSGDTGSAAIEACRDRACLDIFILFPHGRVSEVQRRQMTTVAAANVHTLAIEGTFDDCQDLVKALFNDAPFRDQARLAAVNSINWARIAAQIVYYVWAALRLGAPRQPVAFAIPTGNFGNVFAAHAARRMGLPISRLVIGSNRNDILARFFTSGRMQIGAVHPTLSPSMDIQISSNFERYLFELCGRDGGRVAALMHEFRETGQFVVSDDAYRQACIDFAAERCDDEETKTVMRRIYAESGRLVDPHTAIGIAAARRRRNEIDGPIVAVGTAHPAKFPAAVEAATGVTPALPSRLADLYQREERYRVLPNDTATLKQAIADVLAQRGLM